MERVRKLSGAFLHAVGTVFEPPPLTDITLTPAQCDALITYQRRLPHPTYLGERAFLITDIVDLETSSVKIHKALVKHGILLEAPVSSSLTSMSAARCNVYSEDEMPVKIAAITRNLPHQLASTGLPIDGQKLVVALLCFWYEEWKRQCRFEREERDLREQIDLARRNGNHRAMGFFAAEINRVLRRKHMLWSEREENREVAQRRSGEGRSGGEGDGGRGGEMEEVLPSYRESMVHGVTVQVATGGAARVVGSGAVDELPGYGDLLVREEGMGDDDDDDDDDDDGGAERVTSLDVVGEPQGSNLVEGSQSISDATENSEWHSNSAALNPLNT
ncbi:hypothetical protein SBOR_1561 [Sclerotinia borealis F-4128]|uniref:Uncharacterized protein n=1 Tax=Sclerotinia borealis (strain F-4128) TaxID=1432307 RepID=W9CU43_SCLBF|nr:hypothetical protein SBOR_1561 [Sclerotinia borealis F-4128]